MSDYSYYGGRDPYAADRGYPGAGGVPRQYDPYPPSRSQPTSMVYPQQAEVYRTYNYQPPAPAPQPSTREVKVVYYVPGGPGDPNYQPPAIPAPAPVQMVPVPAPPRPSYVEMPLSSNSNQFREGDTYRVVAIQENTYKARPPNPYRYPGGYVEYADGPPRGQPRGGSVGHGPPVFYL